MKQITRRDAMKTGLKGAAYVAPVLLTTTVASGVSAATPPPTTADIAVTDTVSNATPLPFSSITFTITARNNGPVAATGVVVTDANNSPSFIPNPASITTTPGTTFNLVTGVWTIGPLAVGQVVTLTITGQVGAAGASFINTATRTASSPTDPNPANDSASAIIRVPSPA